MELTEGSETSAELKRTPGIYPKERIQGYNLFSCWVEPILTFQFNLYFLNFILYPSCLFFIFIKEKTVLNKQHVWWHFWLGFMRHRSSNFLFPFSEHCNRRQTFVLTLIHTSYGPPLHGIGRNMSCLYTQRRGMFFNNADSAKIM